MALSALLLLAQSSTAALPFSHFPPVCCHPNLVQHDQNGDGNAVSGLAPWAAFAGSSPASPLAKYRSQSWRQRLPGVASEAKGGCSSSEQETIMVLQNLLPAVASSMGRESGGKGC